MAFVFADYSDNSFSADDLALAAYLLYRCPDFHLTKLLYTLLQLF